MKKISFMKNKVKIRKKVSTLAYAGSFLQQGHGELLENHGYLLWDVKNRTFTEHNIYNEYGYLTIDVENGIIPQWVYDEAGIKLPKNVRLRLRIKDTDNMQLQSVVGELKTLFDDIEFSVMRINTLNYINSAEKLNTSLMGNVRDLTFQNKLITEWLNLNQITTGNELDDVYELNTIINNRITTTESHLDTVMWIPKRFEFSNMFSYGEGNSIDFSGLNGLIGLFAQNAAGKSSVWDSLSFCIFDKSSRAFKAQNIMNNQKRNFQCKFNFELNGVDYFIERTATMNKHGAVRVDVEFWRETENGVESLNGEHRRDTNAKIEQFIGSYDDFILTSLSLQGNNSLFIDKSQTERKDILSKFIGIEIFDRLYDIAYKEREKINSSLDSYLDVDYSEQLISLTDELVENTELYDTIEEEIKKYKDEKSTYDAKHTELNKLLIPIDFVVGNLDTFNSERETLITELESEESKLQPIIERLDRFDELHTQLKELKSSYDSIEDRWKDYNTILQQSSSLSISLDKLNDKLESNIDTLNHLNEHEYNPDCHICVKNSSTIIQKQKTIEDTISEIQVEIDTNTTTIKSIQERLDFDSVVLEQWDSYNDVTKKLSVLEREYGNVKNQQTTCEFNIHKVKSNIETIERSISEYHKNENTIRKNEEITTQLQSVKLHIKKLDSKIEELRANLLVSKSKISKLESEIEYTQKAIDAFSELQKKSRVYDLYLSAIHRDGVPYELISKAIPAIETEVNNILTQIVDFTIQMEMDGKNINAYIVYSDQKWLLEMTSGMERFVAGLAIRVALINLCNLPRPNFLIIDEGLGVLDSDNLQSIFMMFSYLKTQFDFIILISHLDIARDFVDRLMEIKKSNGFSHLVF
jgi:DNA repair exonuclease SbcCD ATPase subunit